jgi:hypothetical protein
VLVIVSVDSLSLSLIREPSSAAASRQAACLSCPPCYRLGLARIGYIISWYRRQRCMDCFWRGPQVMRVPRIDDCQQLERMRRYLRP